MADTQQQLHKMQGLVELPLRFELFYLNRKYAVTNLAPRVAAERYVPYYDNPQIDRQQ